MFGKKINNELLIINLTSVPSRQLGNSPTTQSLERYLPLIMKPLKTLRLILTFYRSFFLATSLITIACISIFWKYGISTFTALFWFKMVTLALVYYFIRTTKTKEFYYYQNLGVSKVLLWTSTLTFDVVIFLCSLILTYKIR